MKKIPSEAYLIIGYGAIGASVIDRLKSLDPKPHIIINDKFLQTEGIYQDLEDIPSQELDFDRITICIAISTDAENTILKSSSGALSQDLLKFFYTRKELHQKEINIIIESTVPVSSAETLKRKIQSQDCLKEVMVFSSPERYLESYQTQDQRDILFINPGAFQTKDYIHDKFKLIGEVDTDFEDCQDRIESYIRSLNNYGIELRPVLAREAELTKLFENHQRHTLLSLTNLYNEYLIEDSFITGRTHNQSRIFQNINLKESAPKTFPGLIGGGCIPIDSDFLFYKSHPENGFSQDLLNASINLNKHISERKEARITQELNTFLKVAQNSLDTLMQIGARGFTKQVDLYIFGIGYKKNSPTVSRSKIQEIFNRVFNSGFDLDITKFNFWYIDHYVEDYNTTFKHAPNYKEQKFIIQGRSSTSDCITVTAESISLKDFNPQNQSYIILCQDNDIYLKNSEKMTYKEFLENKNLTFYQLK